jgi:hypothetical protein
MIVKVYRHSYSSFYFFNVMENFASSFLRIPPCDGHPCLWLTISTIKARSGIALCSSRPIWANKHRGPSLSDGFRRFMETGHGSIETPDKGKNRTFAIK